MRTFLLFAAVCLGTAASAQTDAFAPGFLVIDGEHVSSELALGTEAANARRVRVRSADGSTETYGPTDVAGYGVEGGRSYRSGRFRVRATPNPTASIPDEVDAFARIVRGGPVDLLALELVAGRPQFFLSTEDGELVGLYAPGRGAGRLGELYRQALLVTLDGCGTQPIPVGEVRYEESSLADLLDTYNTCVEPTYAPPTTVVRPQRETTVAFEGGVGYAYGAFRRGPGSYPAETGDPAPSAVRLQAGVSIAPWLAPDRLRVRLGLVYDHDVLHVVRGGITQRKAQINIISLDLGAHVVQPLPGALVSLGTGLLVGQPFERTLEEDINPRERDDLHRFVLMRDMKVSNGQYVELGVEPDGLPARLRVRLQETAFGSSPNLFPAVNSARYGVRSVVVTAVAQL